MRFNPIKKFRKIYEFFKPPKIEIKTDITSISNQEVKFTIATTEPKTITLPILEPEEPITEIKFVDETFCNNCHEPMIEKTTGIKHRRQNSKIRKTLVCTDCGFEKRLA